jgi:PAS domain S-box-containing protein
MKELMPEVKSKHSTKLIEVKILLGFIGALALIIISGAFTYNTSRAYSETASLIVSTQEIRAALANYYAEVTSAESDHQSYLLTNNEFWKASYLVRTASIGALELALFQLISDPHIKSEMTTLSTLVQQRLQDLDQINATYEQQGLSVARSALTMGLDFNQTVEAISNSIARLQTDQLGLREANAERALERTQTYLLTSILLEIAILTAMALAIRREMHLRSKLRDQATTLSKQQVTTKLALRENEELFLTLANNISQLAWMADAQGSIFWYNQRWFDYTGTTLDEVVGWNWQKIHHPDHVQRVVEKIKYCFDTGQDWEDTFPLRGADGNYRWFLSRAIPIRDENGVLLRWFGTNTDVTERKKLETELISAKTAADSANRAKSDFLANMSHELRTPLNAIIGFSEALKDGLMGEMQEPHREYIGDIYSSGEHLLSLINDILDLAKVESGKMPLYLEPVSINALMQGSLSMIKEKATALGISLVLEADTDLPDLLADQRKLKQILYNLLYNAIKFTDDGGRVTLGAHKVDGQIEIFVTDTGIGISAEDQAKLFQPFFQIDSTLSRKHPGTGLGLAMVRHLSELHGGRVELQSVVGQGSTFRVQIPWRAVADDAPAAAVDLALAPYNGSLALASEISSDAHVVLVVEDDPAAAKLICYHLTAIGLRAHCASTGEEALDWLASNTPDVITLDILLPSITGWDVLNRIKAMPKLAAVPVVIISIVADGARGLELGASHALQKPVSQEALRNVLQNIGVVPSLPADKDVLNRILVIDDDPFSTDILSASLKSDGYLVSTADSGTDGIALARSEAPAAVLLNLMMPEVSGFVVLKTLKHDSQTLEIPIIVITSKHLTNEEEKMLCHYAEAMLRSSPFDYKMLVKEVSRVLSKKEKK